MRSTTQIHIAIRNVGNSQDTGQFFNGTLSESILWLATKLAETTMASRIVIGIGRSEEDAGKAIDVRNAGRVAVSDNMKAMLDSIFAADQKDSPADPSTIPAKSSLDGDDYES